MFLGSFLDVFAVHLEQDHSLSNYASIPATWKVPSRVFVFTS